MTYFFYQLFKPVRLAASLDPHHHCPTELTVEGLDVVAFVNLDPAGEIKRSI
jgi:hypothetical protein